MPSSAHTGPDSANCRALPARASYRRRNAASSAVVPKFHMLSATLIVTPGGTISSMRSSTSAGSDPLFETSRTRVIAAGRPLLAAAQHAREVRDGLALEQILDMIVAIAAIHGDVGYTGPILQAALDGLRPPADAKPA